MNLMQRVKSYENIHLAYYRVKNSTMNRELYIKQEEEVFYRSMPGVLEYIVKIFKGEEFFSFSYLEQLDKPKKLVEGIWETRPLIKTAFFEAVIAQCITNILADQIKLLLPIENCAYKVKESNSLYFYEFWRKGYSKFVNNELNAIYSEKYTHVIETDIEQFYPSINTKLLLRDIKEYLCIDELSEVDQFIAWLEKILKIPIKHNGKLEQIKGLPQGPLYSPILAIFYIRHCFDKIKKDFPRIRCFSYVDDIRIYCESEEQAVEIFSVLEEWFNKKDLRLNKKKTNILPVAREKHLEAMVMSKASNLNRAIRDEVILTSDGKSQMKTRLKALVQEATESFENAADKGDKFVDKITRFVNYRLTKLTSALDSREEWFSQLDTLTMDSNIAAVLYTLYLGADSFEQKKAFNNKLQQILERSEVQIKLSYVKYLLIQYLFKWSPLELMLTDIEANEYMQSCLGQEQEIYFKAGLSNMHKNWYEVFNSLFKSKKIKDRELKVLVFNLGHKKLPQPYSDYAIFDSKLTINVGKLRYHYLNINIDLPDYLKNEEFKGVSYYLFNKADFEWSIENDPKLITFKDFILNNDKNDIKEVVKRLFTWLHVQLQYETKRIPCSIAHPSYIWIDLQFHKIVIYGNPVWEHDALFKRSPNLLWKKAFIELFSIIFNFDLENNSFVPFMSVWQYRIYRVLVSKNFSLKIFVELVLDVLNNRSEGVIDLEQLKLDHLIGHYIKDSNLHDNLIVVSQFVKDSWSNGSKDCHFFTIHNQDHARYLIYKIHEIVEKSAFCIFINKKEAFRLFAACYLHDIGMLAEPSKWRLNDCKKQDISNLLLDVSTILKIGIKGTKKTKLDLPLPFIYDIHSHVERMRESIVREEHPFVSEKELVTDYPRLPLTVAERRDIGIISAAHGSSKSKVKHVPYVLHDGWHPIKLRLLSLLLRIADLCDVSKDRVRKEVLERNYNRMSETSIFHWIKHLSVDKLMITFDEPSSVGAPTYINLSIIHNYIPKGSLTKSKLLKHCGQSCKLKFVDDEIGPVIDCPLPEKDSDFKYFDKKNCNITCAFVNEAYRWFYAEVLHINSYFTDHRIDVRINLSIKLDKCVKPDFEYISNRNIQETAQEFMYNYLSSTR